MVGAATFQAPSRPFRGDGMGWDGKGRGGEGAGEQTEAPITSNESP